MSLYYAKNAAEGVERAKKLAETPGVRIGVFTPLASDYKDTEATQGSAFGHVTIRKINGSSTTYHSGGIGRRGLGLRYNHIIVCNYRGMSVGDYQDILASGDGVMEYGPGPHPATCENSRDCLVCQKCIEPNAGVCFADYESVNKERGLLWEEVFGLQKKLSDVLVKSKISDVLIVVLKSDLEKAWAKVATFRAEEAYFVEVAQTSARRKIQLDEAYAKIEELTGQVAALEAKPTPLKIKVRLDHAQIAEIAAGLHKPYEGMIFGHYTDRQKLLGLKGAVLDKPDSHKIDFRAKRGNDGVGIDGQPTTTFYFNEDGSLYDVWIYAGAAKGSDQE